MASTADDLEQEGDIQKAGNTVDEDEDEDEGT